MDGNRRVNRGWTGQNDTSWQSPSTKMLEELLATALVQGGKRLSAGGLGERGSGETDLGGIDGEEGGWNRYDKTMEDGGGPRDAVSLDEQIAPARSFKASSTRAHLPRQPSKLGKHLLQSGNSTGDSGQRGWEPRLHLSFRGLQLPGSRQHSQAIQVIQRREVAAARRPRPIIPKDIGPSCLRAPLGPVH